MLYHAKEVNSNIYGRTSTFDFRGMFWAYHSSLRTFAIRMGQGISEFSYRISLCDMIRPGASLDSDTVDMV